MRPGLHYFSISFQPNSLAHTLLEERRWSQKHSSTCSCQRLSSSRASIISSTSEGRAPKTSARISLAVSSSWRLGFTAGIGALGLGLRHRGHLIRRPPRWSGLLSLPRCLYAGSAQSATHVIEAEDPVGELRPSSRCWSNMGAYKRMPPREAWQHGLDKWPAISQALSERRMLHCQEGVVVLLQDGPELYGGEGPPHYQLDRAASRKGSIRNCPHLRS